jgi:osmotically-inducible protein OsmY
VAGVNAVVEKIEIKYPGNWAKKDDSDIAAEIVNAFKGNWEVPSGKVKVTGHKATLTGTVESWYQKDEAVRIAWNAPGVWSVDNELLVEYE